MSRQIDKVPKLCRCSFDDDVKIQKKYTSIEENNNEINILATTFENMGNLAEKYKEKLDNKRNLDKGEYRVVTPMGSLKNRSAEKRYCNYDYDSDEFENDADEDDYVEVKNMSTVAIVHYNNKNVKEKSVESSIDQSADRRSFTEVKRKYSEELKSEPAIVHDVNMKPKKAAGSTNSSLCGTVGSQSRRLNMSFSNARAREIHRENHILMQKLLKARSNNPSFMKLSASTRESNSAIARRKKQEKTDYENLILLKKIQEAKSSKLSTRR